jgi:hypothetical protein
MRKPVLSLCPSLCPRAGLKALRCLECGKQFRYDLQTMRVGTAMSPNRLSNSPMVDL